MLRLFVGVFLPEPIKGHLQKHIDSSQPFEHFRWIDPVSLHVTLKFLGSVEESRLSAVCAAVKEGAGNWQPISLCLHGGGVFPRPHDPRIFWAGLAGNVTALKQLANEIELALKDIGFPRENREFRPHVTVAKPKGERSSKEDTNRFCKLIENYQSPMFDISSISIVRSQLTSTGARYAVLETIDWKAHS